MKINNKPTDSMFWIILRLQHQKELLEVIIFACLFTATYLSKNIIASQKSHKKIEKSMPGTSDTKWKESSNDPLKKLFAQFSAKEVDAE